MTKLKTKSSASTNELALNYLDFDYNSFKEQERILLQQLTYEIKEHLRSGIKLAWEIGQKLVEIRGYLDYGQFDKWLKAEFKWSRRTAYNYIRIFQSFESCATFAQANIAASVLYLLSAPSTPKSARTEVLSLANRGEHITYSKAKALVNEHKKAQTSKTTISQSFEQQQTNSISSSNTSIFHQKPSDNLSKLLTIDITEPLLQTRQTSHLSSRPPKSQTNEICMALIDQVKELREEQVIALVEALAQHWPEQLLSTLSKLRKENVN